MFPLMRQGAVMLCLAAPAAAQDTLVVTSTADSGEGSLRAALATASTRDAPVNVVIFAEGDILIADTLAYSGRAPLALFGNATRVVSDRDVTLFETSGGADLLLRNIAFEGPGGFGMDTPGGAAGAAGRGIAIALRPDQTGTASIEMDNVRVTGTAGHGIHVTDCPGDCAETGGSKASIALRLATVEVIGTGRGTFGADGLRVDEGGAGGIGVTLTGTRLAENGGHGLALRESGEGDVVLRAFGSAAEMNGDYCTPDRLATILPDPPQARHAPGEMSQGALPDLVSGAPDEACVTRRVTLHPDGSVATYSFLPDSGSGVMIEEDGPGAILASVERAGLIGNAGFGMDLSERDAGGIRSTLIGSFARDNAQDAYRHVEAGPGDLAGALVGAVADGNGGRGFVFDETGEGDLTLTGFMLRTHYNAEAGQGLRLSQEAPGQGEARLGQSQIPDGISAEGVEVIQGE